MQVPGVVSGLQVILGLVSEPGHWLVWRQAISAGAVPATHTLPLSHCSCSQVWSPSQSSTFWQRTYSLALPSLQLPMVAGVTISQNTEPVGLV